MPRPRIVSGSQEGLDRSQHKKVPRIKNVEQPFQSLPLLPVIQGKGDQAEPCRAIISHRPRERQEGHAHAAPDQRMISPEHVEQEYGDDRKDRVIRTHQKRHGGSGGGDRRLHAPSHRQRRRRCPARRRRSRTPRGCGSRRGSSARPSPTHAPSRRRAPSCSGRSAASRRSRCGARR